MDWLINLYDLEVRRLEAQLDAALDVVDTLVLGLNRLAKEGDNGGNV